MPYSLKRATTWNLLSYLYLLLASFITTPSLIRALGLPNFAHYLLTLSIITLVSVFDLGLPRALIQRFTRYPKKKESLLAVARTLTLAITIPVALVTAVAASYLGLPGPRLIPIFLLVLLGSLTSLYQSVPESEGSFGYVAGRALLIGTGNTFGALYLALHGYGLNEILYLLVLLTAIILLFFLFYSKKFKFLSLFFYHRELARSLLSFGLPNQGGKLVGQLEAQYAKFIFVGNPLSLSAYGLASNLLNKLVGSVAQLGSAFYPLSAASAGTRPLKILYYRLQAGLLLLGGLGIWLYAEYGFAFLNWWLQDPSLVAVIYPLLKIGSLSGALLLLTSLASAVMDSHGSPLTTSLFGFSALIIEVGFALALLSTHGVLAPMLGQLISLIILVPPFLYATGKKLSSAGISAPKIHA